MLARPPAWARVLISARKGVSWNGKAEGGSRGGVGGILETRSLDHVGIARSLAAHRKYSNGARYSKFRVAPRQPPIVFEKLESRSGNHKGKLQGGWRFAYGAPRKYSSTMAAFDRMLLVTPFGVVYFVSRSLVVGGFGPSLERNYACYGKVINGNSLKIEYFYCWYEMKDLTKRSLTIDLY